MKAILNLSFLVVSSFGFGQVTKESDTDPELLASFNIIGYWANYVSDDDKINSADSLTKANKTFKNQLLNITSREPGSILQAMTDLVSLGVYIATSEDKKFRIYSWDTQTGGSMRFFDNVYQYALENGTASEANPKTDLVKVPHGFYTQIFTVPTKKGVFYMGYLNEIYSNKDNYQALKLFGIEGANLNTQLKLIKTKTGLHNQLGFDYDFFSVVDRPERPIQLIAYDPIKKSITIPVVLAKGQVSNKKIVYVFDGVNFLKKK